MKEDQLAVFRRRKIGFAISGIQSGIPPSMCGKISFFRWGLTEKVDKAYVNDIITTWVLEHRIHNLPNTLSEDSSSGLRLQEPLVNRPEILLADEPTGNLDSKTK